MTTVVVEPGVVYKSSGVPEDAGITSCDTTLNVFAICYPYPNAIASAVASACAVACVVAPMSDNNSDADLPSILVPFTLKKSSSATPAAACKMLFSEIPVVIDAAELAADVAELAAAVADDAAAVADDEALDACVEAVEAEDEAFDACVLAVDALELAFDA